MSISCTKSIRIHETEYSTLDPTKGINYRFHMNDGNIYESDRFTTTDTSFVIEATIKDAKRIKANDIILDYKEIALLERIEHTYLFYVGIAGFTSGAIALGFFVYYFVTEWELTD